MGFKLGNTSIGSLYLGSTKIVEAYLGSVKVMNSRQIVYNVTCSGSHGTVTASPSSGIPGTVVTLSNSPDTGYKFDSYTVIGATLTGNTFVIGNSDVNVTGNFIQSSEELWVDLGSSTYTAGSSIRRLYAPLTGMPTSSNKNYYTVKFNISGSMLAYSNSSGNREICYLAQNNSYLLHIAGCAAGVFYQNNTKLSNTARFAFSTKSSSATACAIYSSNFIKGQYSSSSVANTAISNSTISTGSHTIKLVVDRITKNVYYYLDNTLICYITCDYANDLTYANSLYLNSVSGYTVSIDHIKVAGFDTLSEAQAWS
jgi:hypothetical protein